MLYVVYFPFTVWFYFCWRSPNVIFSTLVSVIKPHKNPSSDDTDPFSIVRKKERERNNKKKKKKHSKMKAKEYNTRNCRKSRDLVLLPLFVGWKSTYKWSFRVVFQIKRKHTANDKKKKKNSRRERAKKKSKRNKFSLCSFVTNPLIL